MVAQVLRGGLEKRKMELKRILHLGSRVLLGAQKEPGVVDALTASAVGVVTAEGYVVVGWEEVALA